MRRCLAPLLFDEDDWENAIGLREYKNFQLLHRHCHDEKTRADASLGNQSGFSSAEPKPLPAIHYKLGMDRWNAGDEVYLTGK